MRVSPDDIINFNNLYLKYRTYAGVARETGFSASTVKKYIIPGYEPAPTTKIKKFEGELPEFHPEIFREKDWSKFCKMSEKEYNEIKEFWEELAI